MIKVKKVTLTPANIYAMFATRRLILAAPASGFVNNIISISHYMDFNTLSYNTATVIKYTQFLTGNSYIYHDGGAINNTTDTSIPLFRFSSDQQIYSTELPLYVTTDAAATDGNSNIIAYIVYEEKAIS